MDADLCNEPTPDEPLLGLLKKEAGFARNLAKSLLFDDQLADDVVQQAWLTALQRPPSRKTSVRGWFLTVVRNLALKALRTKKRRDRRELASAQPEKTGSTGDAVEREHVLRSVTDAVLALDEPYRHTILLRFFDDLPPRDIAARDGVPVATVQSRITRGLAKLRESLDRGQPPRASARFALGLLAFADPARFAALTAPASASAAPADGTTLGHAPWLAPAAVGVVGLVLVATYIVGRDEPPPEVPLAQRKVQGLSRDPRFDAIEAELNAGERGRTGPRRRVGAPPAGLDPATTALRVLVRRQRDGAPAARIAVRCIEWSQPNPQLAAREERTDDDGYVWFQPLAPGLATLVLDRGGRTDVTVADGKWTDAFVCLPVGVAVAGRVLAPDGSAAAGASVWLSGGRDDVAGRVVAMAGADGAFTVADVAPDRSIAAIADGFAPSDAVLVAQSVGAGVDVVLRVRASRESIAGVVRAADGAPVPGARVEVEALDQRRATPTSAAAPLVPPASLVAAADGSFHTPPLAPGRYVVRARARGFAPAATTARAAPEGGASIDVVLERGARVSGRATYVEGAPAAGVRLAASIGGAEASVGRSAADGTFLLEDVCGGTVTLRAEGDAGALSTTLHVRAGEERAWDPRLERGEVVRGVLHDLRRADASAAPAAPAPLTLMLVPHGDGALERNVEVDGAGRFAITLPAGARAVLEARTSDALLPLAQRLVRAGDNDADLEVPAANGSIAFQLAFADGQARDVTADLVRADAPWRSFAAAPAQDRVRASIDDVPAGAFRVVLRAPGCAEVAVDNVRVRAGGVASLGAITFEPAGALVLEAAAGASASDAHRLAPVEIRRAQDGFVLFRLAGVDLPRTLTLAAGRYVVATPDANPASVEVYSGGTSTVRVP